MLSIPVDILRHILEHVDKASLVTICQLNKICCSCSQDILYRHIHIKSLHVCAKVCPTLAQSPDLARRVHSFSTPYRDPKLADALRNMIFLRDLKLDIGGGDGASKILDGCTFKLDMFNCSFSYDETLRKFLVCQPNLTDVSFWGRYDNLVEFEATCLPDLTRVAAWFAWLPHLIPGRAVSEVNTIGIRQLDELDPIDLSFFTLSTVPIKKLTMDYSYLEKTPTGLLASIFPSLTHFTMETFGTLSEFTEVCRPLFVYLITEY
jgi:F-box domain